jgi:hypothetical protein
VWHKEVPSTHDAGQRTVASQHVLDLHDERLATVHDRAAAPGVNVTLALYDDSSDQQSGGAVLRVTEMWAGRSNELSQSACTTNAVRDGDTSLWTGDH